ncbi:MAG UNVERIFIED_CONTAM: SDR family oxidoreductase [Planctomycetaceae bacterium]|jgi:NAD(P)-dependent dehydrogenase (short-subunit alcohol dehydrogenase family)
MEITGRVVVVTGAARGIGAALCRRLAAAGALRVIVSDRDTAAAELLAQQLGPTALAIGCDVGIETEIQQLVTRVISECGRIDVFCSNAGITVSGGMETLNADWQRMWDVNVMSRVYAARAVLPQMLAQGEGYLLHTASAAGLLTEIGSASYSVTKHADVALAEWLSTCHGRSGIRVSCVCPLGVETDMLDGSDPIHRYLQLHAITADQAAESIVEGMRAERFLILPHPQVMEFFQLKGEDYDRWLRGMQRLRQKLTREAARKAA